MMKIYPESSLTPNILKDEDHLKTKHIQKLSRIVCQQRPSGKRKLFTTSIEPIDKLGKQIQLKNLN